MMDQARRKYTGDLPLFPVVIGVTGHREIASGAEPAIRCAVRHLLNDWLSWFDPALHVLTALASGADQLVADEARHLGIPIIAVLPMPLSDYLETFPDDASRERLEDHRRDAVLELRLPEIASKSDANYRERQYEQLGVLLARRSHLLLALWNGEVDTNDRCGTGAVTRMRIDGEFETEVLHKSPLFDGADSWLDMTWRGPLLQVFTPKRQDPPDDRAPGACSLLGLPQPIGPIPRSTARPGVPDWQRIPVVPETVLETIQKHKVDDFRRMRELNGQIAGFHGPERTIFNQQVGYLDVDGVATEAWPPTRGLVRLQAAVDTAAQAWQVRLLGHFVPAPSVCDMIATAYRRFVSTKQFPTLGAAFIFAAVIPLAVMCFEYYASEHHAPDVVPLLLYIALLAGTSLYYEYWVANQDWQSRFQDYRALAEAMRVQIYWAIAADPAAVSDHYLRKQSGELGWIQFALRGPALWAATLATTLATPHREIVNKGWIDDQIKYFRGKAPLHRRADERGRAWTRFFVYCAIVVSVLLVVIDFPFGSTELERAMPAIWPTLHDYRRAIIVLAATLPGLAAAFTLSGELRAYEPHAHSYALMLRMFSRAEAQVRKPNTDDAAFRELVRALGREALAENAEWLVEHRHRKIEHRS